MTDEEIRQRNLARTIGKKYHHGAKLVPVDSHSSFVLRGYEQREQWHDAKVDDVVWWAVATIIQAQAPSWHIIDHAWMLAFEDKDGKPREAWGFVAEPYLNEDNATDLIFRASIFMEGWPVQLGVLPKDESSWNPGGCVPIVATFLPDRFTELARLSVLWALNGPLA